MGKLAQVISVTFSMLGWVLSGCIGGGCPLDHTEVVSVDPPLSCLVVSGNGGSTQCVTASMNITNNCKDTLVFASGWTNNGGKLSFAPGESGVFDATDDMQTSKNNWTVVATLGSQPVVFVLRTVPN